MSDLLRPLVKAPLLPSRVKLPCGFDTRRFASGEFAKNAESKKRRSRSGGGRGKKKEDKDVHCLSYCKSN
jgi:hypothetical protein